MLESIRRIVLSFFLSFCLMCCIPVVRAQSVNYQWAGKISSLTSNEGTVIRTDDSGNVYIGGEQSGNTDFDPGEGAADTFYMSGYQGFIVKLDSMGSFLWAVQLSQVPTALVLDDQHNVYACGRSSVYKYTTGGAAVWNNTIAGSRHMDLSVMGGNLYTTGYFYEAADFDPGTNVFELVPVNESDDIFIAKYDTAGVFSWAKTWGSSGTDRGMTINVDAGGNLYATGVFMDTVDFDPGLGLQQYLSQGPYDLDIYVMKLQGDGNFLWAKQITGDATDFVYNADLDAAANIYITGNFGGTTDFDPGVNTFNLTADYSQQYDDAFICKLDMDGNFSWAKSLTGPGYIRAYSISVGPDNHVYTTGELVSSNMDPFDFDPGTGAADTFYLEAATYDMFISRLDQDGGFVWAYQLGGALGADKSNAISVDDDGNVYTTGYFNATVDFDPGSGTADLTANFNNDCFVLKLGTCYPTTASLTDTGCVSYTYEGEIYFNSGTYTQILANAHGCDSIVTLNLIIKQPSEATLVTTACDSFEIDGMVYTASGTYTQTLVNAEGCDSIVTLDLTIHQATTQTLEQIACKDFFFDGQHYTASGSYTHIFTASNGCDSTIVLVLQVDTVGTGVTQSDRTLTALTQGATYQWIDCMTGIEIGGAASQVFTSNIDGNFAVIVTLANGCSDTSACYAIGTTSIDPRTFARQFNVHPNPVTEVLYVTSDKGFQKTDMKLVSISGQVLKVYTGLEGNNITLNIGDVAAGIYLLEVTAEQGRARFKIIKQ